VATESMLTREPIDTGDLAGAVSSPRHGAVVTFDGVVRGEEAGEPIAAIVYEAYDAMAEKELRRIVEAAAARWSGAVAVRHRVGRVPVGEASLVVACGTRHRKDAFEALAWVVDEIKASVPLWKTTFEPLR
jgi:molybdopterin synthase catalytic subunit